MLRNAGWIVVAVLCACSPRQNTPAHPPAPPAPQRPALKAVISADYTKLTLGEQVLLEAGKDGFLSIHEVRYSPAQDYFLVIGCGYECNDNVGFLFAADGSGKRKFTARWDFILQTAAEWSADGKYVYYYRINSSGAEAPAGAPAPGWVQVEIKTGTKAPAATRVLKPAATYRVFNVAHDDVLNVRAAAGAAAPIAGTLPATAAGVRVTGTGVTAGGSVWVPIRHGELAGWINQNFLCEE